MANPNGTYYSDKAPFLSALAAICMGSRSERAQFSVGRVYQEFCTVRYGLTPEQTRILLAPGKGVPASFDFSCVPTPDELRATVHELAKELARPEADRVRPDLKQFGRAPDPAAIDPILAAMFPTLVALFAHYILGQGAEPVKWEEPLYAELWPEGAWFW